VKAMSDAERVRTALAAIGVDVASVYDLVNRDRPYPEAVPVLIGLLQTGLSEVRTLEGVVRALGVREARGHAASPLITLFETTSVGGWTLKWAIGNALYTVARADDVPALLKLLRQAHHGRGREMLVPAIARFDSAETRRAVLELLRDDDLTLHAVQAASKLRLVEARPLLEKYAQDQRAPIRKAAVRALETINRTAASSQ
jgi:HEAT repeat protein